MRERLLRTASTLCIAGWLALCGSACGKASDEKARHASVAAAPHQAPHRLAPFIDAAALAFAPGAHPSDSQIIDAMSRRRGPWVAPALKIPLQDLLGQAQAILDHGFELRDNPAFNPLESTDWASNPKGDRNWHFQINSWGPLRTLYLAHVHTGQERFRHALESAAYDWIDFNIVQERPNAMKWYDMATGRRAELLAYLLQIELGSADPRPDRLALLLRAADAHRDVLADPKLFPRGNHGIFMMVGLRALLKVVPGLRGGAAAARYAESRMAKLLRSQYSDEGIHLEHSPGYHAFVTREFQEIAARRIFDMTPDILSLTGRAAGHFHEFVHPDGTLALFGDTESTDELMHSPELDYVMSEGQRGRQPADAPAFYPKSGYAIVRSPWSQRPFRQHSYLAIAAGFHSASHKHADQLSFEWSERGQAILQNSGKFTYDRGPWRDFFTSTRASNSVEIDATDFAVKGATPYGSALTDLGKDGSLHFVEARTTHPQFDLEQRRLWVLSMGHYLCVVDELRADAPHTYRQWFGFHEALEPRQVRAGIEVSMPDGGSLGVTSRAIGSTPTYELVRGRTDPRPQGWISRAYGTKVPRYSLAIRVGGKRARLITLFSLGGLATHMKVAATDRALTVQWHDADGHPEGFRVTQGEDEHSAINSL